MMALLDDTWLWVCVVIYFLGVLLDNVDGQLARVQDRASYFGKLYDGAVDSVLDVGLPVFLGLHLFYVSNDMISLLLGVLAGLSHAMMQVIMLRYNLMRATHIADGARAPRPHLFVGKLLAKRDFGIGSTFFESFMPSFIWDIRAGGLILAILLGSLEIYLIILAAAQFISLVGIMIFRGLRAYYELDVYRVSSTATMPASPENTR